jgi:N-6 DNA Methylase
MTLSRLHSPFTTIRTEGALLPADLLQRVLDGDLDLGGVTPESYHLSGEKLNEAINRSWNRLQGAWAAFREAAARLPAGDPATTVTRERWLLPLCQELGYGRLLAAKALEIEGKSYPISHGWEAVPLHLVGARTKLDERTPGVAGAARSSPHSLVQELLNRDASRLWGFVSNGLRWRVLRDNASLTRQAFVEFDLEAMFAGEVYADFAVFWLVCHQSRVEAERPEACWLEQWSHAAQERGTRALETLRKGVEDAISALGSGFLAHRANGALRDKLRAGNLSGQDYYRQLLRLVYRLIFLFVAEDRDLLLLPAADPAAHARYTQFYSTTRLRGLAERLRGSRHADLYVALRLIIARLGQGGSPELGLPELGSFLFSAEAVSDLAGCELANADLLEAVRALAFTVEGRVRRAVDYKNLGPEELGSVYESLLELHPELNADAATFALGSAGGNERKTTGSHYSPTGLINCLLDSALDPVIEHALEGKKTPEEASRALLALKVCDPACGSGHFLIGAAYRIAKRLAAIRTGEAEPSPEALRTALREVIGHCLYGVDLNPMAVELCKVNLWLESLEPGKPLTFLDHHIQCGNSLIGATPALLARGIPDEAFTAIEGDDKKYCAEYKKRNKHERAGQLSFALDSERPAWDQLGNLSVGMARLEAAPDDTPEAVRAKQSEYEALVKSAGYEFGRLWADAWCAAFVWKKTREFAYPITESVFRDIERNPFSLAPWMRDEIRRLASQYSFFHWHLAFPEVFRLPPGRPDEDDRKGWEGGFDCVLGNPPWEALQVEEQAYFAARDPEISQMVGKRRKTAIQELVHTNPALLQDFREYTRTLEAQNLHYRMSGCFPLTSIGKMNTYALFAELAHTLLAPSSRSGIVVPTGIATDDTTKEFFGRLVSDQRLAELVGFENEAFIFPAVHHATKFCALIVTGLDSKVLKPSFVFFCRYFSDVRSPIRRFELSREDFGLLNPNTLTCPTFRTQADAELARKVYARVGVLVNERTKTNRWHIRFQQGLFNMSSDSALFKTSPAVGSLPLYEAKLIYHFDHRYSTYQGATQAQLNAAILPQPNIGQKVDPSYSVTPRYWVDVDQVEHQLNGWNRNWLLAFRDITGSGLERTAEFAILPRVGVGHTAPLILFEEPLQVNLITALLANLNSLVFDYSSRQKVGGLHLSFSILKQLPTLAPTSYGSPENSWIVPRVLELTYTAWNIKGFADDLWRESNQAMRDLIQRQSGTNTATTGGHTWDPRAWAEIAPDACPLPPFKWDEDRRSVLRAEIDAYYARLYGLTRDELRYILDPKDVYGPDFPGETFRVLKEKEERRYGEYRTRRLVLEAWDSLEAGGEKQEAG